MSRAGLEQEVRSHRRYPDRNRPQPSVEWMLGRQHNHFTAGPEQRTPFMLLDESILASVSYTHLDVYKRQDYVQLYFPPDAKAKMDQLVTNVKLAMGARLDALDWMGPETKVEAKAKLQNFGLKIGHPETWRDYSGLQIANADVLGNAQRSRQFEWDYRRARIGKPVDKAEWGMTPQTVNAYYSCLVYTSRCV